MTTPNPADTGPLFEMISGVAPVLVPFTQDKIIDELWHRPGLAVRDRAIVTVATLVARNAQLGYPYYFNKALDSGVSPAELSELMTHLAFYASWPYAFGAIATLKGIFEARCIDADQLPTVAPDLLPLSQAVPDEQARMAFIGANVAPISAALQHFTDNLLYHQVWRRPGLASRDRGLASVAILAALGQSAFFPVYLGRAVQHGLTETEVGEMLAHTAFYAGWGNAIQAAGAAKAFFDAQKQPSSHQEL